MCAAPAVPPLDITAPRRARPRCPRCQRPQSTCLCRWITPTANEVSLLILQHPQEQHQAKGSARLLQLSLARCRVEVGESFDPAALAAWLDEPTPSGPATSLLLFPGLAQGVRPAAAAGSTPPCADALPGPAPGRLVLLDGTWRQARRLLRANPLLQALPRWPLPAPPPSRYAIRQAQRPEQRSTLEAACLALGALEHRAACYGPLLAAFDGWVATMAAAAAQRSADLTASAIVDSARPSLAA